MDELRKETQMLRGGLKALEQTLGRALSFMPTEDLDLVFEQARQHISQIPEEEQAGYAVHLASLQDLVR